MEFLQSYRLTASSNIVLFITGSVILLFALFADLIDILKTVGFPVVKLSGERGQTDLAIFRAVNVLVGVTLVAVPVVTWKNPYAFTKVTAAAQGFLSAAARLPLFTTWFLGALVLAKTALQFGLFLVGYRAYAGDDFSRSLKADHWLQHAKSSFDLAAWLNLESPQLPFPDYLFGLALSLSRDVYITPKVVNLLLSGIAVVVVYLLGRDHFGRAAGLFAAMLCAFQPVVVWLGLSGMTSDLPSVIMIALFGFFLFRWIETYQSGSLLAAAGCLFAAGGMRYENWLFIVVFSLFLVYRLVSAMRTGSINRGWLTAIVGALVIANAFPIIYMAASYHVYGYLIPSLRTEVISGSYFTWTNFSKPTDPPKINMALLAISTFPLEIAAAAGGIALFLKSEGRKSTRLYLVIVVITVLLFTAAFKGRLPVYGAGPERILLPYVVLLMPYAGFLLTRLFQASGLGRPVYALSAGLFLLTLGIFDLTRAFNYPAKKYDRDAFAAGWTLRTLQGIEAIPDDGKIIIEKGEKWIPFPILALANKPERFVVLGDGDLGKTCNGGLQTPECKDQMFDGSFNMIILSSPEKVRAFQEIFRGRAWHVGKYHIFELNFSSKDSQTLSRATTSATETGFKNRLSRK
jgi:hypothetical protein